MPENIAEGVDIAGIVGTLASASGGSEVQIKTGHFTPSESAVGVRIPVDFGFIPDFILVYSISEFTTNNGKVYVGYSSAVVNKYDCTKGMAFVIYLWNAAVKYKQYSNTIDGTSSAPIYNADDTGFNLGMYAPAQSTYYYCAMKLT